MESMADNVRFTEAEKNSAQRRNPEDGSITIIFSADSGHFMVPFEEVDSVFVYGTFTHWHGVDTAYRLTQISADSCYYRTFTEEALRCPGNSGHPECYFFVFAHNADSAYMLDMFYDTPRGEKMDSRLFGHDGDASLQLMLEGDDPDEMGALNVASQLEWTLADWDTQHHEEHVLQLTNYRRVPGTENLYRSYHPYHPGFKADTEFERLTLIPRLAERHGILSDITLCGNYDYTEGRPYPYGDDSAQIVIPDYYKNLRARGNVLFVGTENGVTPSYNETLWLLHSHLMNEWIAEMVRFIIDDAHPVPILMHCSYGAERTGAMSAVLAALCGAGWEQIAEDFEATGDMRYRMYRHRNLVRYSLEQLTGVRADRVTDLRSVVRQHLIDHAGLTAIELDALERKLTTPTSVTYAVKVPLGTEQCYIAASWSEGQYVQMDRVDSTHFTLTRVGATSEAAYHYACGPADTYSETASLRRWHVADTVAAWSAVAATQPTHHYRDITIRMRSSNGAPAIQWRQAGDRCMSSVFYGFNPSAPCRMKEEERGLYAITLHDVDRDTGISYRLRRDGVDWSDEMLADSSVIHKEDYSIEPVVPGPPVPYEGLLPMMHLQLDTLSLTTEFQMGQWHFTPQAHGEQIHGLANIRHRGSSSLIYDKPSIAVKLCDSLGNKMETSLLGMRSDNYWVLDAMASDKARMRNRLCNILLREAGVPLWYADQEPEAKNYYDGEMIDLWMDTTHMGLYCLMERIDRKQLKLKKYSEKNGIRGVMYKTLNWDATEFKAMPDDQPSDQSAVWHGWEATYPELDEGQPIDWSPLLSLMRVTLSADSATFADSIADYLDIPTFTNYIVLTQVLAAQDNTGKNVYWSCYDIQSSPRMTITLWDMDHSLGRNYKGDPTSYRAIFYTQHGLYQRLLRDYPDYLQMVEQHYARLRQSCLILDHLGELVDDYFELYKESGMDTTEVKLWNNHNNIRLNFATEPATIKNWLRNRLNFLDSYYHYNPTPTGISDEGKQPIGVIETAVYDIYGRVITRDLRSGLPRGIYIVREGTTTRKIFVP